MEYNAAPTDAVPVAALHTATKLVLSQLISDLAKASLPFESPAFSPGGLEANFSSQ